MRAWDALTPRETATLLAIGRRLTNAEIAAEHHISLRTVTSDNFLVIDTTARDARQTKRRQIIAEVDWKSAFAMIYPKAIYMVESEPFEVQELRYRED